MSKKNPDPCILSSLVDYFIYLFIYFLFIFLFIYLFIYLFSGCLPVGIMDTNKIPDNRMTASSSYRMAELPHYGRLNETRQNGAWCPKSTNNSEYLQVDMGVVYDVCAVVTQGRAENSVSEWVTGYRLRFSLDGIIWYSYYENNVEKVSSNKIFVDLDLNY